MKNVIVSKVLAVVFKILEKNGAAVVVLNDVNVGFNVPINDVETTVVVEAKKVTFTLKGEA